ncbi:dihydropteroate synthase [Exilibacterium tricleocarpae]|uniref:Dihydropteroate synthase n=2 Tax=Exilibacterium tricleocarpae TaxID=2591008 RepID=A0A545TBH7_9GAMM|nr:dihydropteroate synthase [Exilibacterium tricleocarpae]TQV74554.1 dihydropteroate synthase [Exilibacterium tricleocarpae]
MYLSCADQTLDLSQPTIMGVLNTTPDSFSDGGSLFERDRLSLSLALQKAQQMVLEGAAIIDVGGESTRPGAAAVSQEEELQRVVPVVEAIRREMDVIVSVDTSSPAVMTAAAAAGAGLINDVRALRREGALAAAVKTGLPVCLMHMQGEPGSMQDEPRYDDVVTDVAGFLARRLADCERQGLPRQRILLDPGFGFGKTVAHNLALLKGLDKLAAMAQPLLVGLSRKSLIGKVLGRDLADRLPGSLALMLMAVQKGAHIVRVHDVAATADVLKLYRAVATA